MYLSAILIKNIRLNTFFAEFCLLRRKATIGIFKKKMRKYFNHRIKKLISVREIVTIEYLELKPDFSYGEEVHGFWEFVYVDVGSITCSLDGEDINIATNEFMLIQPNTRHSYFTNNQTAPTIFVLCFRCNSQILEVLKNKVKLTGETKKVLADIMNETKSTFRLPFDTKLRLVDNPIVGGQQLIENYLEELLIKLVRHELNTARELKFFMSSIELENSLVNEIIGILKDNLYGDIDLDQISKQLYYSKTYLNNIFKNNMHYTIMNYYNELKINEAKKLLREHTQVSKVAEELCFESANYFSKVFKKYTNLTPKQYKKTIY